MVLVPALEWHVVDACNFTCEGCAHLSNMGLNNIFSIEEIENWYKTWSAKVIPERIAILGGEPLLHKKIVEIIYLTRKYWNDPRINYFELVTNGTLLHKYPDLPKALQDNNCTLALSIHHNSSEYVKILGKAMELINEWRSKYNFEIITYDSNNDWGRIYKGWGNTLEPYEDNDIEKSWENCLTGKECFQLYNNKIYKCPMVTFLPEVKKRYNLSSKWDKYLEYTPLLDDATHDQIKEFFNRQAESVCSMCPAEPQAFNKKSPLIPIKFYKNGNAIQI